MSEEEIIERVNFVITNKGCTYTEKDYIAIECLLDLYNKQKEEIEELKNKLENVAKIRKCFIEIYNDKDNKDEI